MQTFTLGPGGWLRCLVARNPLVRLSDRVEALAILLILLLSVLAVPVAGAFGTAIDDSLTRRYEMERATRQVVTATVTDDSMLAPQAYAKQFVTPVRWIVDGIGHDGEFRTDHMTTGEQMSIWVDTRGEPTSHPLPDEAAATEAVVTGFGLWFTAVGVLAAAYTVLRSRLNRSRRAAWDRALEDLADGGGRSDCRHEKGH